jgi:hypothetical protein
MLEHKLCQDRRGAILVIGLFAALSLCGALWVLIGVGDAILLHDRGQQAADAAALSSAAVHARAMNATGALNFVMLALTGAYLSFSVVADLAIVTAAYVVGAPFGEQSDKAAADVGAQATETYQTLIRFEQQMGTTINALDQAQTGLASGAPVLGSMAAQEVAEGHKYTALTLGWSNFPATALPGRDERAPYKTLPNAPSPFIQTPKKGCTKGGEICTLANKLFPVLRSPPAWDPGPNTGRSLGLPFAAEPASSLCVRVGELIFRDFGAALAPLELGEGADKALDLLKAKDKRLPITVHCSDTINRNILAPAVGVARPRDLWTAPGPKRMTAASGSMAMRVLAWAATPEDSVLDDSVRRIKLASYDFGPSADSSTPVYDAQAEFFYGCSSTWESPACNHGQIAVSGVGYEHALYWMNWRARLTRSRPPGQVFGGALNGVVNAGVTIARSAGVSPGAWERMAKHIREQGDSKVPSLH